jgi:hypothetical protein
MHSNNLTTLPATLLNTSTELSELCAPHSWPAALGAAIGRGGSRVFELRRSIMHSNQITAIPSGFLANTPVLRTLCVPGASGLDTQWPWTGADCARARGCRQAQRNQISSVPFDMFYNTPLIEIV